MDQQLEQALVKLKQQQDKMLQQTIELASINSGSFNYQGVNATGELMLQFCQQLDASTDIFDTEPLIQWNNSGQQQSNPLGKVFQLSKRPEAPLQIYLGGHLDTVFAKESQFQTVEIIYDKQGQPSHLHGPGVTDLKGGLIIMLHALLAFEQHPLAKNIGWTILLNPDEEIGSPASAPFIEQAAQHCDIGMIYEPCFEDGNFAGARKGSGNYAIKVSGKSAHAGREHHLGRNAIRALADFTSKLDQLNLQRQNITINPGIIHGGDAVNSVPDWAILKFNVRIKDATDQKWFELQLSELVQKIAARDGISIEVSGGFSRPAKQLTDENKSLLQLAIDCAKQVGIQTSYAATGGCCDGNNLAALGLANIDTLGAHGGKIHSAQEFLIIDSLYQRAQINYLLLHQLASNPSRWIRQK